MFKTSIREGIVFIKKGTKLITDVLSFKAGFTVAELAIIIGVIGVIAAITMPLAQRLIDDIEFEPGSQKLQAQITQTLDKMNADQTLTGYATTAEFINTFKSYLETSKTCPSNNLTGCFPESFKAGEDEFSLADIKGSEFMGKKWKTDVEGLILKNGFKLLIAYNPNCSKKNPTNCTAILYDLNSIEKDNVFKGNGLSDLGTFNAIFAGGGASGCAFKLDGTCFGAPFTPTPYIWEACNAHDYPNPFGNPYASPKDMETMSKYGFNHCLNINSGNTDYWVGAMIQCNELGQRLPTMDELASIANYVYGTNGISSNSDQSDITLDINKANSLGITPDMSNSFSLWSSEEVNTIWANARNFDSNSTIFKLGGRSTSTRKAMCVID